MREQSVSARLRKAGFTQVAKAEQLLEECARAGVAPPRIEAFAQAADPDQCLLLLTRLVEACPEGRQLRDLLEGPACRRLLAVLGLSKALGDFLVAHPEALSSLETRSPGEAVELEDFTEEAEKGEPWPLSRRAGQTPRCQVGGSRTGQCLASLVLRQDSGNRRMRSHMLRPSGGDARCFNRHFGGCRRSAGSGAGDSSGANSGIRMRGSDDSRHGEDRGRRGELRVRR